jgi:pimeloyl-ACP methyl ester carboxylesterase
MKIYLIPGLGFDHRIFQHLDFQCGDVRYLDWIDPIKKETIVDYTQRLFAEIADDQEKKVLIGHSFGGVVAQEIAAVKKIDQVILLSSIRSRDEMPRSMKLAKPFGIHHLFTKELSVKTVQYWGENHGFESYEDQAMFKSMVGQQSNLYLQWAFKTISGWSGSEVLPGTKVFQIHGTNDKTFPLKKIVNPDKVIENGSHIMVFKQPDKINKILNTVIEGLE